MLEEMASIKTWLYSEDKTKDNKRYKMEDMGFIQFENENYLTKKTGNGILFELKEKPHKGQFQLCMHK